MFGRSGDVTTPLVILAVVGWAVGMWWIRRILRGEPEPRSFRATSGRPSDRLQQVAVGAAVALLALIAVLWLSDASLDVVLGNAFGRPG